MTTEMTEQALPQYEIPSDADDRFVSHYAAGNISATPEDLVAALSPQMRSAYEAIKAAQEATEAIRTSQVHALEPFFESFMTVALNSDVDPATAHGIISDLFSSMAMARMLQALTGNTVVAPTVAQTAAPVAEPVTEAAPTPAEPVAEPVAETPAEEPATEQAEPVAEEPTAEEAAPAPKRQRRSRKTQAEPVADEAPAEPVAAQPAPAPEAVEPVIEQNGATPAPVAPVVEAEPATQPSEQVTQKSDEDTDPLVEAALAEGGFAEYAAQAFKDYAPDEQGVDAAADESNETVAPVVPIADFGVPQQAPAPVIEQPVHASPEVPVTDDFTVDAMPWGDPNAAPWG